MSLLLLFNQGVPRSAELTHAISSADWTGIAQRLADDPVAVATILDEIAKLDELIAKANLSNADRRQAGSAIDALTLLSHAPQPEWRAIVVLLNGPTIIALCNVLTIAGMVVAIIDHILG
ncbi:hypothetical protein [Sphingomonas sp. RB1R13]|uniref:hypothetical protein n=1 Tax=Sphingomonas sp. RB1R13 TaxID=3096159 RepID=UPI002FCB938A